MSKSRDRIVSVFSVLSVALAAGFVGGMAALSPAQAAHEEVAFQSDYPAGVVVISKHQRRLYFTEGNGRAIRYPIAVGKPGKAWLGETSVAGKYLRPDWSPPAVVHHDHPELPNLIKGDNPHNPMGAAAIMLERYEVAIHGTNAHMRASIGTAASYGCIRMYNEDVLDLFDRVNVGTPVYAIP